MFDNLLQNVSQQVGTYLPGIVSAIAVLIVGWILAHLIARIIRIALKKTGLGDKLSSLVTSNGSVDAAKILSKIVFYIIMLFVLITFFNVLNLPVVSEPLNAFLGQIFSYAPRVFSAAILGIIAYVLARCAKDLSRKGLEAAGIDNRLASFGSDAKGLVNAVQNIADDGLEVNKGSMELGGDDEFNVGSTSAESSIPNQIPSSDSVKLSETLPDAVYWIILALFLPAILGALQLTGLLEPVQAMFHKAFSYMPNIIGAAVIFLIGMLVAKIVRQVASNLAASVGVNQLATKFGVADSMSDRKLSDMLGMVVYALIMLPVVVASLNTLDIEAVTKPASDVLGQLTSLIPGFIGAGVVLAIAYFVGKLVADLVEDLLAGVGFDSVPQKMGLNLATTSESLTPSKLGGKLVLISIILLSALQALPMMGLESFASHLETFTGFAMQVLIGIVILALGMFIANAVAKLIKQSGVDNAGKLAVVARIAILVFAGGFGLQQMGLSASIVNVAFGSILGGLGLAAAIAFGWGGRDAAKRILDRLID